MYCDNCGIENRNDANFCYKCSRDLSHIPDYRKGAVTVTIDPVGSSAKIDESTTQEQFSRILDGRYALKEMLGRGGMGVVYRAHDQQLGMDIAIKFLLDRFVDDYIAVASLKREAKAAMQLAHPNIIRLYNFEDMPEAKYLLMEFVKGESLASIASRKPGQRFSESDVKKYISEVCEALKYAHARNVIHRDIKPSNILVAADGHVKLADFGVAHIIEAAANEAFIGGGTPIYMSPEQILEQEIDGRSDIYSVGITIYEMLAGRPPFSGSDVNYHHVNTNPKPIRGVSDWMNTVALKCLRKEPDGRWRNAEELGDVLRGKKEIGVSPSGVYQPEWLRVSEQKKMVPPKTPHSGVSTEDVKSPEPKRLNLYREPLPARPSAVHERVERIRKISGLTQSDIREHGPGRTGIGTLAGLLAGAIMVLVGGNTSWSIHQNVLFQLSWVIYGGLIGIGVGIAQKRAIKGLLSLTLGVAGGAAAMFLLKSLGGPASPESLKLAYDALLCSVTVGVFLGVSEGIYEKSFGYMLRCLLWGAIGGCLAAAAFWICRNLLSEYWRPFLDWLAMGVTLGFFLNLCLGFARKSPIEE